MAIPVRRPRSDRSPRPSRLRPSPRRRAAGLRDLTLAIGLVAIVVCGTSVTARAAVGDAADLPAAALAVAGALAVVAALVRAGRRRRVPPPLPPDAEPALVEEPVAPVEEYAAPVEEPVALVDYTAMDADTFEQAVAELCVRDGCLDVEVVGGAGDLGADVLATAPDGRRVVVQCKCYGPDNKVGSQDMQRFGGTCFAVHEAQVAVVVTTSEFTEPAAQYAAQCGILCVDRQALDDWTNGTGPAPWSQAPLPQLP
ncbi:restriction endonuclease [Streptomyces sp. NPDC006368]|uniref:restriction endonuclease n=1 Tax=Streptomyces sp. NPDC006368 TaxID=3156760 RepID=UPI0033A50BD9